MQHTRLTKLSSNKLHKLLTKRYKSPARIAEIKQWVAIRKKAINTARVEKRVIKKRWAEIIKPLTKEIKEARSAKIYHAKHNPELHFFFTDYLGYLVELRGLIERNLQVNGKTPHKNHIKHWVDMVDKTIREDLEKRYNNIPYPSKHSSRRAIFNRKEV